MEPSEKQWKAHRFLPAVVVLGWALLTVFPLFKDIRALVFLFLAPAGFMPWLERLAMPQDWRWPLSILLMILFLALPWFSILAANYRATIICTLSCLVLAMLNISGCQMQKKSASRSIHPRSKATPHLGFRLAPDQQIS